MIGLSKGGVGGMLGPLITATMALALPADVAVGILLPLLVAGDAFAIAAHWRNWSSRHALRLVPPSIVGVLLAVAFVADVDPLLLRQVLAIFILLFLAFRLLESRIVPDSGYRSEAWHGLAAGGLAGFTSGLAHVGGPPVSIYLLMQELPPPTYAATSALFFAILNLIKVPFYGFAGLIDGPTMLRTAWLLPLLPIGVWAGKWFTQQVARATFQRVIMALLLVSALFLLVKS